MTDSAKLDLILSRLDKIDERVDKINEKVDKIEERVDKLNEKVDKIDERVDRINERVDKIEKEVTEIKLVLENEVRVNIQRVAEGHLDLSRNLHETLKIDSEKEMLAIRVSVLETEIRRIKAQLEIA